MNADQRAEQSRKNLAKARAVAAKRRIARKRKAEKEREERLSRVGAAKVEKKTDVAPPHETLLDRVVRIIEETDEVVPPFDPHKMSRMS